MIVYPPDQATDDEVLASLVRSVEDDGRDALLASPLPLGVRKQLRGHAAEVIRLARNLGLAGTHEYARAVVNEMLRQTRSMRDVLL